MSATALQLWLEQLPEDFWWATLGTFVVHELVFLLFNGFCAEASPCWHTDLLARVDMVVDEYNLFQRYKLQKVCSRYARAALIATPSSYHVASHDLEGSQTEGRGYVEGVRCPLARPHYPAPPRAHPRMALASLLQLLLRRSPFLSVRAAIHKVNGLMCALTPSSKTFAVQFAIFNVLEDTGAKTHGSSDG